MLAYYSIYLISFINTGLDPRTRKQLQKIRSNRFFGKFKNLILYVQFRRKTGGTSSGWLKKLRTTITPNWLSADAKLAITEEEFLIDDTGVDLTEASVIPDDDMEPDEEPR